MDKKVITCIPDREYDDLYQRGKKAKKYSEVLYPDKVPTEMWIADGKLMSRMKGELLIKQILPSSQMPKISSNWKPQSGFAKAIDFIMKRDNLPYEIVSDMMLQLYRMHNLSKETELPQELLENLHIGRITEEELKQMEDSGEIEKENEM